MSRPSVILIRECAEPLVGCCRITQSSLVSAKQDPAFETQRAIIERMGAVYQALRQRFGYAIDVQVLDPRNIALPILLIRDSIRYRVGLRNGWRTLSQMPTTGVVVNGRIVDHSERPDARAIVTYLAEAQP